MPDKDPDFRTEEDHVAAEAAQRVDEKVRGASSGPVDEKDMAAAEGLTTTEEQGEHYREMAERGANQKGEGAVP